MAKKKPNKITISKQQLTEILKGCEPGGKKKVALDDHELRLLYYEKQPPWLDPGPKKDAIQIIEESSNRAKIIELFADTEYFISMSNAIRSQFLDECGNYYEQWKRKWEAINYPTPKRGLDLLIAGAEFQYMANTHPKHLLQNELNKVADDLFEAGLTMLSS